MSPRHLLYKIARAVAGWIAVCAAFGTAAILYSQVGGWLRTAVWLPYTLGESLRDLGVPWPQTQLLGVQKIIYAVLHWPATAVYTVIAIAFWVIWVWIGTEVELIASAEYAKVRRAIDEGVPPKLGNTFRRRK
jgi:hypothetical protein